MRRAERFDALHAERPDPWNVETSWYERRKRALTLAMLPRERYARAFEPGCSIGALSCDLACRCDELVVADVAPRALEHAAVRLSRHRHVAIRQLEVPAEWPHGVFDLIVLSEVAYFLSADELDRLIARVDETLVSDGDLVLVNWRGPIVGFDDLDGDTVHARFRQDGRWQTRCRYGERSFLVEVFSR